jgi:hypothetical protein
MENELTRAELEQQIIEKSWAVDVTKLAGAWLDDKEFDEFLSAWGDLVNYYAGHADDTVISVEVLREYLHFTRLLRRMLLDRNLNIERREQAEMAIGGLENALEDIITEVVTYLDSLRP